MNVSVSEVEIAGPLLVSVKYLEDARGFFSETYNAADFAKVGIASRFVQDNHSLSRVRGTVRGLHFQSAPHAQEKLIRVVRGSILDVVLDVRKGSPTYGQHVAVELRADNRQFFVPVGFAHGFCTLEPDTEVIYKVNDFWAPGCEGGVFWNDPALAIAWPEFAGALVAPKDTVLPRLEQLDPPFTLAASL